MMAFVVSPCHDANCVFLIALIHVGFVGNLAAVWRYQISSGCVFSLCTLWMALVGGGCSGKNSVGGFVAKIMSMFLLRTIVMRGMHHSFAFCRTNLVILPALLLLPLYPLHRIC